MRILYFHQHFTTPDGAGGTRSYEIALRLLQHGHQVTMVCGSYKGGVTGLTGSFVRGKRRGTVKGIEVIEYNLSYSNADSFLKRTGTFLKFAAGSSAVALREKYDVVFATTTPLTAGIPGILARWLRRKTFVFEVRDLWPELPRQMGVIKNPIVLGAMSALEWISYRSADRCIALSPGIRDGIKRRGVPGERIEMVPNGCDLGLFEAGKSDQWYPEGVSKADLMAVFTGTHGQANGLDAVLDAAIELKRRGRKDIKTVLVGDGKLKPRLVERARNEDLTNVVFLDPVPKHRITGLLASADIGMQCLANIPAFYFGTSPNKFFDYIAAGLPVLNNYPGWVAKLITENNCGYVVPPEDAKSFADALEMAADNRNDLAEKGRNARTLAEHDFDRGLLADRWVKWVTTAPQARK